VTEEEWLSCADPLRMVDFLCRRNASARKLRLFACACYRTVAERFLQDNPDLQRTLEVSERYADELVSHQTLVEAAQLAAQAAAAYPGPAGDSDFDGAGPKATAEGAAAAVRGDVALAVFGVWYAVGHQGHQAMAELARELFGNPFRQLDPRAWRTPDVRALAAAIYQGKEFARLPILADALEEAGCTDEAVLRHCRQRLHVPGCWVVDLVRAVD
jgi:hypothetical protein